MAANRTKTGRLPISCYLSQKMNKGHCHSHAFRPWIRSNRGAIGGCHFIPFTTCSFYQVTCCKTIGKDPYQRTQSYPLSIKKSDLKLLQPWLRKCPEQLHSAGWLEWQLKLKNVQWLVLQRNNDLRQNMIYRQTGRMDESDFCKCALYTLFFIW